MELSQIEEMLNSHEERIRKLEGNTNNVSKPESSSGKKQMSLTEFILEKKLSDALQLTVSFAYYLEKFESQDSFNIADMQNCFKRARETIPANISDKINQCIKKGWIAEHREKKDNMKSFYITNKGVLAVENNFKKEEKE